MTSADTISALNRLYYLVLRSFAAYSLEVRPVTFRGPEEMYDLLKQIVGEQRTLAEHIAEAIRERRAAVEPGQFPIEFTAWNDVALPRVLEHSLELLREVVSEADAIAEENPQPPVYHFAREVRHLASRHVEQLEQALGTNAEAV